MCRLVWVGVTSCFLSFQHVYAVKPPALSPEVLLVGLYVDTVEKDTIDALKVSDDYFIALDTFNSSLGLSPKRVESGYQYDTPIGRLLLPLAACITHQDVLYVNIADATAMGTPVKFNQSKYAIEVYPPWSANDLSGNSSRQQTRVVDHKPETVGLNHIDISGSVLQKRNNSTTATSRELQSNVLLGLTGNAFSGLWGGQVSLSPKLSDHQTSTSDTLEIQSLYWALIGEKTAWRMGANANPSFDTSEIVSFSGVSAAYSNQNISRHIARFDQYNKVLLQNNYDDYRKITGEGPVGGVAELHVNDNPVARVRIGIDKRYEFRNLNLSKVHDSAYQVKVLLFEHRFSKKPIAVRPYRLAERKSNVATGEFLAEVGLGRHGNVLKNIFNDDSNLNKDKGYGYGYFEYGVNNNLSVRASLAQSEQTSALLGLNAGISQSTNLDMSIRKNREMTDYEALLFYTGTKRGLNYQLVHRAFDDKESAPDIKHTWFLFYNPTNDIQLSTNIYHHEPSDGRSENYFTTSAFARLNDQWSVQVNRDRYNDFGYRADWDLANYPTRLSFLKDTDKYGVLLDHQLSAKTGVGAGWYRYHNEANSADNDGKVNQYNAHIDHRFHTDSKFYANATTEVPRGNRTEKSKVKLGYELGWQYRVNDGFNLEVGYRRNTSLFTRSSTLGLSSSDDEVVAATVNEKDEQEYNDSAFLRVNLSLANLPAGGLAFASVGSNNKGSILTNMSYDDRAIKPTETIHLQLNNKVVKAERVGDGQYLVNNITPGVYKLSLDNKNLPIEYTAHDLPSPLVEVGRSATTVVPYRLEKRLGFSGRLLEAGEEKQKQSVLKPTGQAVVQVFQDQTKVATTQTNPFGYYQVLGLKAGVYTVKTANYQPVQVELVDTFEFGVDLPKIVIHGGE